MIEKQPSCDDVVEPELLPVEEARRRLFASLKVIDESIELGLADAFNRVLLEDVVSPLNVPPQANSAMDGYAIHSSSIPSEAEATLEVVGKAWAGQPYEGRVETGQAVRIFTGGIMPEGCDTVVIQEHVRVQEYVQEHGQEENVPEHARDHTRNVDGGAASVAAERSINIDSDVVAGKNVRAAGEDVAIGQCVLQAGRKLGAADIGVLASLGIARVRVVRPLKVAFFSTGDELRSLESHEPGTELAPGLLFDSNRFTMNTMLKGLHVELIDMGIVRDNEADTRQALLDAAAVADVVITSGGVSAGEADFVTRVFHDVGEVSFWKLAMRPGRPLAYGQIGKAAFFGLPGNPVAVMVTFLEFVQPALKHLSGMTELETLKIPARCLTRLRKSPGRVEYQRGVLSLDDKGELVVESTGMQGAGRLSSMSKANCLMVLAVETDGVQPGDRVMVQPFQGLLPG